MAEAASVSRRRLIIFVATESAALLIDADERLRRDEDGGGCSITTGGAVVAPPTTNIPGPTTTIMDNNGPAARASSNERRRARLQSKQPSSPPPPPNDPTPPTGLRRPRTCFSRSPFNELSESLCIPSVEPKMPRTEGAGRRAPRSQPKGPQTRSIVSQGGGVEATRPRVDKRGRRQRKTEMESNLPPSCQKSSWPTNAEGLSAPHPKMATPYRTRQRDASSGERRTPPPRVGTQN
mmetsp:Transcript_36721/g.88508  ORF Transcript_36721/g.88508 Transcript_36721/m.88508 type:complete len:236 (-) Transcript_36721:536-1243(-)